MKFLTRIVSVAVLGALATFYMACDDGGTEKTPEELQFEKLNSSWALTSANDGTDRTGDFPGLVLTVSGTFQPGQTYNYSLTGTRPNPSPWPANGTWKFGTDPNTDIIRDPGSVSETNMNYTVTDSSLTLEFNVPEGSNGWPGGKIESVEGNWTFVFSKQ